MTIQRLPSELVNQIAAGEVVERPASVIKELVENALDAGAQAISVELEQGGLRLMRVRDDGGGIPAEELALACSQHATSKIASLDDLQQVSSFGFRGEALASILSVSRFRLASRTADSEHGWAVEGEGTLGDELLPSAQPTGTLVEVRELFCNTPARRKFLRTETTEMRHVDQTLKRLALARADVGMALSHNGRRLWHCPPQPLEARARALLGEAFFGQCVPVESAAMGLTLQGWIGVPAFSRAQTDMQHCFINGRVAHDRVVSGAVRRAYADVLHGARHPAFLLFLSLDPARVDVNVHPAKREVRFRDAGRVHDFLFQSLHRALRDLKPGGELHRYAPPGSGGGQRIADSGPRPGASWVDVAESATRYERRLSEERGPVSSPGIPVGAAVGRDRQSPDEGQDPVRHSGTRHEYVHVGSTAAIHGRRRSRNDAPDPASANDEAQGLGYPIGQLHDLYIVAQNAQGLVLVDQHAAHERVLYERLKRQYVEGGVASQQLLVPVEVRVPEDAADVAETRAEELAGMGLEIERSGPGAVRVRAAPPVLPAEGVAELLQSVLGLAADSGEAHHLGEVLDAQQRVLADIACRAAIRGRRRLSLPEMERLLRDIEATELSGQCNHGRPTWVQMPLEALDRLFLRGK